MVRTVLLAMTIYGKARVIKIDEKTDRTEKKGHRHSRRPEVMLQSSGVGKRSWRTWRTFWGGGNRTPIHSAQNQFECRNSLKLSEMIEKSTPQSSEREVRLV